MDSEVEAAVRGAIDAINDRTLRARTEELLDPSIVRHDLVQLFPDSQGTSGGSDFVGMILAVMPDCRLDIQDIFSAGDRAAVRIQMTKERSESGRIGLTANGPTVFSRSGPALRLRAKVHVNGRI